MIYAPYDRAVYGVAPVGRFVMVEMAEAKPPPSHVNVIMNWTEELKRLVPTHK